jgi:hypothetical protein
MAIEGQPTNPNGENYTYLDNLGLSDPSNAPSRSRRIARMRRRALSQSREPRRAGGPGSLEPVTRFSPPPLTREEAIARTMEMREMREKEPVIQEIRQQLGELSLENLVEVRSFLEALQSKEDEI